MLPLAMLFLLGAADLPAAAVPVDLRPAPDVNAAVLYAQRPPAFETRVFPTIPISRVVLDIGSTLARPLRPELGDLFVIVPGIIGTAVALKTDVETHRLAQKLPDPSLGGKHLSDFVAFLGEGWLDVSVFLAIGLIGGRDGQRACIAGLEALAAAGIASRLGKVVFRLERPSYDPDQLHFFSRPQADAMPSGHAMAAFATAAVLAQEYPKLAPLFYTLALWVGVARVQQGAHWFSDVIVGAALGTLFGWQSWKLTRAYEVEVQPWAGASGGGLTVAKRF